MEKIKQFIDSEKGKDALIVVIVILVGLGSFQLGRLSKQDNSSDIKIEYPDNDKKQEANVSKTVFDTGTEKILNKTFFASSRGSKYYSLGCSAGKSIKQENRVYFKTGEEAQAAGYELSSSCR